MFPINAVIAEALKVKKKRKVDRDRENPGVSLSVDKTVLQQLKAAIRGGGEHAGEQLQEVQRQLFLELDSPSGAGRLKALQLIDFLFLRSPAFRARLQSQHLRTLVGCSQAAGLPFVGALRSAAPRDHQAEVRDASLRMIEIWCVLFLYNIYTYSLYIYIMSHIFVMLGLFCFMCIL
jgi:hypothetical protein